MRKIFLIFLFILLVVILSGCMSSPARKYYQLYLSLGEEAGFQTIDKIMLIDKISIDSLYDDYRIVYRESPYQLNFYSYEFWAEKPSKLVRDAIAHYLLEIRMFQKVIQEISKGEPDLIFRSRIHAIEEVDTAAAWYARLAMEMEISDFRSGELMLFHHFDRREKLDEKDVKQVPIVISRILREELGKVVRELSPSLKSRI